MKFNGVELKGITKGDIRCFKEVIGYMRGKEVFPNRKRRERISQALRKVVKQIEGAGRFNAVYSPLISCEDLYRNGGFNPSGSQARQIIYQLNKLIPKETPFMQKTVKVKGAKNAEEATAKLVSVLKKLGIEYKKMKKKDGTICVVVDNLDKAVPV